ncbi:Zn-ribbon domain-containing OB-fold protein [Phenylobacterium sp.]|uniref:Zn-ribbon domain-containing OB-fold protein n=1 Tax=Phenylobacterium sp. TaxID=1871053 RepID=UPI0035B22082
MTMEIDSGLRQNHPEAMPFSEAAAEGRFVVPTCGDCGRTHWYPRAFCPFCFSPDVSWQTASGDGEIYSYCNPRPAPGTHVIAYVKIPEGPILLTHLVDTQPDDISIGMPVKVALLTGKEGHFYPAFRPA